jgi:methyltransferase (TIGR00027 family)
VTHLSSQGDEIRHVSDTALMVAACRALETEEPDAFARDPFAARLAGERGFAILNGISWSMILRFGLAVRTRFLDELLANALATAPIRTVLSVGCGLDTRPWRIALPPDLRWIEVDFPDVLDYKHGLLASEKPHCHIERLSVDLNNQTQRRTMYAAAGTEPSLVITEGVLMYLPAATVDALAAEIPSESGAAHWLSDITTSDFSKAMRGGATSNSGFEHVRAPDALEGEQILQVLRTHGWMTKAMRSYLRDAAFTRDRARRIFGDRVQSAPPPFAADDPTGIHHFGRSPQS